MNIDLIADGRLVIGTAKTPQNKDYTTLVINEIPVRVEPGTKFKRSEDQVLRRENYIHTVTIDFTNPKSVDVAINALKRIKRKLEKEGTK